MKPTTLRLPEYARLNLALYFKSPSTGEIAFIDAGVSSVADTGELQIDTDKIEQAEEPLIVLFNAAHGVSDFRTATREEIKAYIDSQDDDGEGER